MTEAFAGFEPLGSDVCGLFRVDDRVVESLLVPVLDFCGGGP